LRRNKLRVNFAIGDGDQQFRLLDRRGVASAIFHFFIFFLLSFLFLAHFCLFFFDGKL